LVQRSFSFSTSSAASAGGPSRGDARGPRTRLRRAGQGRTPRGNDDGVLYVKVQACGRCDLELLIVVLPPLVLSMCLGRVLVQRATSVCTRNAIGELPGRPVAGPPIPCFKISKMTDNGQPRASRRTQNAFPFYVLRSGPLTALSGASREPDALENVRTVFATRRQSGKGSQHDSVGRKGNQRCEHRHG
jgi:hypothetical protein